jgi:hypothetical protein
MTDPETTEPPGTGPWSDDPAADWGDADNWDPWAEDPDAKPDDEDWEPR